jgi:cytochrome b561
MRMETSGTHMQLKNSEDRYGAVTQLLHWAIVALIIVQFVLADKAEDLPRGMAKIATLAQHKSFGITILFLVLLRVIWRWMNPRPKIPSVMPRWQQLGARISHFGLYALLFVTPLLGWTMSSARNFPVSYFGLFTLPNLVSPNRPLYEFLNEAHEVSAKLIFVLAVLHAAAALKHHFIDKDNVLRRMLPLKLKSDR